MLAKFSKVLALVVILSGLGVAFNSPSYAKENFDDENSPSSVEEDPGAEPSGSSGNVTFHCDTSGSVPRTIATGNGERTTVIRWIHKDFSGSGFDPLTRCEQVSRRFQRSFNDGSLKYVTAGLVNGMPVICAAGPDGGGCNNSNILFTLRRGVNAAVTMQQLFDVRNSGGAALEESSGRTYINLKKKLAPVLGSRRRSNQPTSNPRSNPRPSRPSQPGRVF